MIKITAKEIDGIFCLEAEGHAGYNPGNDIVCSAASVLVQLIYACVVNGIGFSALEAADLRHGKAFVRFRGGETLFEVACLGAEMLRRAYPENVDFCK